MKRPPGHSPSDFASTAMSSIEDRIRASEAYRKGRAEVVRSAIRVIGPAATFDHLKALGGITAVVRTEIEHAKTPGLDKNLGSQMFPLTARELLAREAGLMRTEVQSTVARAAIPTGHSTKAGIRYLKITDLDGARYILRVTRESPEAVIGIEVDSDGEEIVPRGTDPQGRAWHLRLRKVPRTAIKKAIEMRMNLTYASLEPVPKDAHATKREGKAVSKNPKLPFDIGDLVAASYRVPPFLSDDVLVVKEMKNLGTKTKPKWRVRVASLARRDVRKDPKGETIEGWLDAEILERPSGWGRV
jgi:hypothetical protein